MTQQPDANLGCGGVQSGIDGWWWTVGSWWFDSRAAVDELPRASAAHHVTAGQQLTAPGVHLRRDVGQRQVLQMLQEMLWVLRESLWDVLWGVFCWRSDGIKINCR